MSYIALYREWRPSVFEDVVEQEHIVKTLRHSISSGRIAHAYLFCGTRGTGKTTMAHIFSRGINCLNPINGDPCNKCEICREILSGSSTDVLEIDAASNNSVDNVREIRDEVIYLPSKAKYKVYIIDEVHMLSSGAFNALLKTLEEPPSHVVFILATTEPHKLPATILSRCQRFDFRRITIDSIVGRLNKISESNAITLHEDAARLIAKMADGALRDAISLLDQCIAVGNKVISYQDVLSVIGIVNDSFMASVTDSILEHDTEKILLAIDQLVMDGKDISHFVSDLVLYFRNLLICKVSANPAEIINVPSDTIQVMKQQSARRSREEIMNVIRELSALESSLKWAVNPRIMLEVTLVKLCSMPMPADASILDRLAALESAVRNGITAAPGPVAESNSENQDFMAERHNDNLKDAFDGAYKTSRAGKSSGERTTSNNSDNHNNAASPIDGQREISPNSGKPAKSANTGKSGTSAKASSSIDYDYMDNWNAVLDSLKSSGRMKLYTYLFDTKAVNLSENSVGVVFKSSNSFGRTIISKAENLEVLQEAVSKIKGQQVQVRCLDEDNLPQKAGKSEKKEEAEGGDLVEKARSLAEAAGVPFNIIDE